MVRFASLRITYGYGYGRAAEVSVVYFILKLFFSLFNILILASSHETKDSTVLNDG